MPEKDDGNMIGAIIVGSICGVLMGLFVNWMIPRQPPEIVVKNKYVRAAGPQQPLARRAGYGTAKGMGEFTKGFGDYVKEINPFRRKKDVQPLGERQEDIRDGISEKL